MKIVNVNTDSEIILVSICKTQASLPAASWLVMAGHGMFLIACSYTVHVLLNIAILLRIKVQRWS